MGELGEGGGVRMRRKRPCLFLFIHGCTTVGQAQRGQGFVLIPQNRDSRLDKSDLLLVGDLNLLSASSPWQRGVFYGSQGRKNNRPVYENDLFASFFFPVRKPDTQNKIRTLAALSVRRIPEST